MAHSIFDDIAQGAGTFVGFEQGEVVSGIKGLLGGGIRGGRLEADPTITQPETAPLRLPTRQGLDTERIDPKFGTAPGLRTQTQKQVSGEDIQGLLKGVGQFEATTGREVTAELTEGLSRSVIGAAADRSVQNRQLALQEFGLELQKFGLDSGNTLNQASLVLQQGGQDRQFALNTFAQDLQASGMEADQSFRVAQQAIDVQIQNESNKIKREAIEAGIAINESNARAQGMANLINIGVTAAVFAASERSVKDNIVEFKDGEHVKNLEEVKNLPLYHFKYKDGDEHMIGAMIDEMPEDIIAADGRKVNLYSMNTMLMSAVKSLLARVETLEAVNGVS